MTAQRLYVAEPVAAYGSRPPMVVDCSVVAAVVFDEPSRDEAARLVAGRSLHAPFLLDHEIASVALKKQVRGARSDALDRAIIDYLEQRVTLHRTDVTEQFALAGRYQLSAYDAAYLWLAAELRAPLVTFDRRLGEAGAAHLGTIK
jgi:predicted nucleic acid-binding protein